VTFELEPRRNYLRLLGYDTAELSKKVHRTLYTFISVPSVSFIGANLPLPPSLPPTSLQFSTWTKMSVSTLSSTLDVQELSQKLSILGEKEEREKGKEGKEGKEGTSQEESETSSTAALFGSEGGMYMGEKQRKGVGRGGGGEMGWKGEIGGRGEEEEGR